MKGVTRLLQVRTPHRGLGTASQQRQWGSCLVLPRALSPAQLTPADPSQQHQRDQHLNCQFSREGKTSCSIFPFPPCLFIWTSNWYFTSGVNQSLLLQQHHLQRTCQKKIKYSVADWILLLFKASRNVHKIIAGEYLTPHLLIIGESCST